MLACECISRDNASSHAHTCIHIFTFHFLFMVRGKYECSCLKKIASFLIIMEYLSEMYTLLASFFFKEVSSIAVLALPKVGFGR